TPATRAARLAALEEDAPEWHFRQAERANANGQVFAVRVHLPYLDAVRPRTPAEHVRRGRLRSGGGEWEKAVADYSAALEAEKDNPETWGLRGQARAALGQWDRASDDYSRAVALKPAVDWIWSDQAAL